MITLERLRQAQVIIKQMDVCQTIPISKNTTDLRKQQKLDSHQIAIQQINFTGNLDSAEGATIFFIIEEAKETVLDFSKPINFNFISF